jgi:hypothetical protein
LGDVLRRGIDTQIRKQITANCSTATPTSGDMPRTIHIEALPSAVDDKKRQAQLKRNLIATWTEQTPRDSTSRD